MPRRQKTTADRCQYLVNETKSETEHRTCGRQKLQEVKRVLHTNTIAYPWAVMVKTSDTLPAFSAMLCLHRPETSANKASAFAPG
mmetsp:Transcript_44255/g.81377  ORF Transcript_44255/g.81377 Transcript_44255/m.81377 type:complete len:85 (+) Transcript_44255:186-440(+)